MAIRDGANPLVVTCRRGLTRSPVVRRRGFSNIGAKLLFRLGLEFAKVHHMNAWAHRAVTEEPATDEPGAHLFLTRTSRCLLDPNIQVRRSGLVAGVDEETALLVSFLLRRGCGVGRFLVPEDSCSDVVRRLLA